MATIRVKRGKYQVEIKRNGVLIYKTFSNKESAELYKRYREELEEEMNNFDVPKEKLITLDAAIDYKIHLLKEKNSDPKTISDTENLKNYFSEFLNLQVCELTKDMLQEKIDKMLHQMVRRGGTEKVKDSGRMSIQSPATVKRKMSYLSAVYSSLTTLGITVHNPAYPLLAYLTQIMKQKNINV